MKKPSVLLGQALMAALALGNMLDRIPFYKRMHSWGGGKALRTSKYESHQGEQEMARRRRQKERGII